MTGATNAKRQLSNWVFDYASLVSQVSESPPQFNIWSAISVVSAVLKNNVWIGKGVYKIFPNQYIVLVGRSGIGKGTAIKPAHDFAREPPGNIPLANYVQDKITAAKLCDTLYNGWPTVHFSNGNMLNGKDSSCILQATELATLVNTDGMITLLTETWDKDSYIHSTMGGGKKPIKNMCISMIGACTSDFIKVLNNRSKGDPVNSGLTARIIFVHADQKFKSMPWPDELVDYTKERAMLENDLQEISRMSGKFIVPQSARDIFSKKYMEIDSSYSESDSDVVSTFKARQAVHILKVAMALSAASNDSLIIRDCDMLKAIDLIEDVLQSLDTAFSGVGTSELAEGQDKILRYIQGKGVCSLMEIIKDNRRHVTPEDLTRILYVLSCSGLIHEFRKGQYRDTRGTVKP
jgi:hypothetical protein